MNLMKPRGFLQDLAIFGRKLRHFRVAQVLNRDSESDAKADTFHAQRGRCIFVRRGRYPPW